MKNNSSLYYRNYNKWGGTVTVKLLGRKLSDYVDETFTFSRTF